MFSSPDLIDATLAAEDALRAALSSPQRRAGAVSALRALARPLADGVPALASATGDDFDSVGAEMEWAGRLHALTRSLTVARSDAAFHCAVLAVLVDLTPLLSWARAQEACVSA